MKGLLQTLMNRRTGTEVRTSRDRVMIWGRPAGVHMTPDEALRISAAWACVTVIAKSIAASEWDVFTEDLAGNREPAKATATWRLLNLRPNGEMKPIDFREALVIQALIFGNAFAEIERDQVGRPVALWPIVPDRASLERNRSTGALQLRVANNDRDDTILAYDDVFHVHGPSIDGVAGFDVVAMALRTLAHSAAAERFGSAFYANGATFGGAFSTEQKMGEPEIDDLRDAVNAKHTGPDKAFRFMVLHSGLKYESISTTPEASQFIETRQFMVVEICRWFGVPPHKVAHLLNATFSNIEHQGLEFVRDALTPWCERLRQEADWKLVPGSGRFLRTRINIDWLSEGDAKSRAETDGILVTAGIKLRDEARRDRGLNPLPDGAGKVPTVNPGTTALPLALKGPTPAAPAAADPPPPEPAARRLNGAAHA